MTHRITWPDGRIHYHAPTLDVERSPEGMVGGQAPADSPAARAVALSPEDQHFLAQLAFDRPLTVELEREARLTAEGLIRRRYGQLVLTPAGRELLGLGPGFR